MTAWGYDPGGIGDNKTGKTSSLMQLVCYVFDGLWTASLLIFLSSTIAIYFPLSYADYIGLPRSFFLIPYPPTSSIVPYPILWQMSYHAISVVVLILYDTSTHKAVVL